VSLGIEACFSLYNGFMQLFFPKHALCLFR
jgi:hypothetical protein